MSPWGSVVWLAPGIAAFGPVASSTNGGWTLVATLVVVLVSLAGLVALLVRVRRRGTWRPRNPGLVLVWFVPIALVVVTPSMVGDEVENLSRLLPRIAFLREARAREIGTAQGPVALSGRAETIPGPVDSPAGRPLAKWFRNECHGVEKSANLTGAPFRLVDASGSVVVHPGDADAWFRGTSRRPASGGCTDFEREVVDGESLRVLGCVVAAGEERRVERCGDQRPFLTDDLDAAIDDARSQATESLRFAAFFLPLFAAVIGVLITVGPRRPGKP